MLNHDLQVKADIPHSDPKLAAANLLIKQAVVGGGAAIAAKIDIS